MTKEDYLARVKRKYPYLDVLDIEDIYEYAKEVLLNTYDPFHKMPYEVPSFYEQTLLQGIYEVIDTGPMRNFTAYQENGCTINKEIGISTFNKIPPYAG